MKIENHQSKYMIIKRILHPKIISKIQIASRQKFESRHPAKKYGKSRIPPKVESRHPAQKKGKSRHPAQKNGQSRHPANPFRAPILMLLIHKKYYNYVQMLSPIQHLVYVKILPSQLSRYLLKRTRKNFTKSIE